ncbi:MAG TPA: DUF1778 domain-containing protein [Pyrinomonadaceae bacterium]|nr:DUF1778 domain-containing protein [Pyrinomonadaceae bacterium]
MAVAKAKKVSTANKDRMHFRLAPDIKARVVRAASITGQGLTDFAISALSERADEILERHDTVLLDTDAYGFFLESLDHRRKPSPASRAAAARYRRGQRKGLRHRLAD